MAKSLTIFGATGGTGRQLVDQALASGYEVTAVVRDPSGLQVQHPRLRVLRHEVLDPDGLQEALSGAGAVLSALGQRSRKAAAICAPGTANIIKAMRAAAIRRLIVTSAAPVQEHGAGERLLYRLTVKPLL